MTQSLHSNLLNILPAMAGMRECNPVEIRPLPSRLGNTGRVDFNSRFHEALKAADMQKMDKPAQKSQNFPTHDAQSTNKPDRESGDQAKRDLEEALRYLEELLYKGQIANGDVLDRLERIAQSLSQYANDIEGEIGFFENFLGKLMDALGYNQEQQNALLEKLNGLSDRDRALLQAMLDAMKGNSPLSGEALIEKLPKELQELITNLQREDQAGQDKNAQIAFLSNELNSRLADDAVNQKSAGNDGNSNWENFQMIKDGESLQFQTGDNSDGGKGGRLFDYLFNNQHDTQTSATHQGFWQNGIELNQLAGKAGFVPETVHTAHWDEKTTQILGQIKTVLTGSFRNGVREIQVQLVPEHLGKVRINIEMKQDVMTGKLTVENETVKQAVESNIQHLKEALERQNIKLDSLEVAVNQDRRFWFSREGMPNNGRNPEPGWNSRTAGENDKESLEKHILYQGGDTGRRLGYNTLELVA